METLTIIFFIIFFSISTFGYGKIFLNYIDNGNYKFSVGEIGLIGFFLISLIVLLIHFFYPISQNINIIIYIIGTIYFFQKFFFDKKKVSYLFLIKKNLFLLFLFCTSIFMFIKYVPNEDFGYYHLPYIINLNQEKIIFGLSNLQLNQGWNSMWLNLKSTYNIKILGINGIFFSDLIFYLFISLTLYKIILNNFNNKKSIFIFYFSLLFFIFLNLKFSRLNSYGLDVPSNYLIIYICILFFFCLITKKNYEKCFSIFEFLILFSIFSTSFRLLNILTLILPLIILIKFRYPLTKILKSKIILISTTFFLLWQIQQLIYTGCIFFPNIVTCVDNLSWFDPNIIENFNADTSKVNKSFQAYKGELSREEYLNNFNWVNNWFDRNKIEIFEHILTFIFPFFIYTFFLNFKKKKNKKFNFENINFFVLVFLVFSLLIWFIKAPVMRFGTIYIQSIILLLCLILFKKKVEFLPTKRLITFLIIFSLSGNLLRNIDRLMDSNDQNKFIPVIPKINYQTKVLSKINLNTPIKNNKIAKSELCWDVPSLCRISGFNDLEIKRKNEYIYILKK